MQKTKLRLLWRILRQSIRNSEMKISVEKNEKENRKLKWSKLIRYMNVTKAVSKRDDGSEMSLLD